MASRAVGALFGLVAAIVFVASIVSPVLEVLPGWWDGHPTIAGHVTAAKTVHITPLGGTGCNTGGAGECQSLPLTSTFKVIGYAELALVGLAALLAALLALSVWRVGDRRKGLGKAAIGAALVAAAGAGAMLAIGPLDAAMHVAVPIGPGLFMFGGAIVFAVIAGAAAQKVEKEPLRLKSSLARMPRPTQPPAMQPARDVREMLRDQHDHLRPSALADAPAGRGSAPLLSGAPGLRPLYEAQGAMPVPSVQVPVRAPTPMSRDAIAALTGVTPPPALVQPAATPPSSPVPLALRAKAVSAPPPQRSGSEPDSQPIDPPPPTAVPAGSTPGGLGSTANGGPATLGGTGPITPPRTSPRTNPPPPLRSGPPTGAPAPRTSPPTSPPPSPRTSPPTNPPPSPRTSPPTKPPPPRTSPATNPPPVPRTPDPDAANKLQPPAHGRSTPMLGSTPLKQPPGPAARAKAASVPPPVKLPGVSVPAPSSGPVKSASGPIKQSVPNKRPSQPTISTAVPPMPTPDNQPAPPVLPAGQPGVRAATDADDRLETALRETEPITAVEIDHEAKAAAIAERQAIARARIAEEQQLAQAIDATDTGIEVAPARAGTESGHTPAARSASPRAESVIAPPPPAAARPDLRLPSPASLVSDKTPAPRPATDTGVDPRAPVVDEAPAPALAEAEGGADLMKTVEQNPKATPSFTTKSSVVPPGAASRVPVSTAPASLPPPKKTETATSGPTPACPQCEAPMAWVEEHLRFYCKQCRMYF